MGEAFAPTRSWWKQAVVYQIYPISFLDSNGDGFGDLNGIHAKLDYLKDLGVDVIWLSPIYRSPLADMGYDISDYQDINPQYGTLDDWDSLLKGAHDRGMRLMMDLVINHTSDEVLFLHLLLQESRLMISCLDLSVDSTSGSCSRVHPNPIRNETGTSGVLRGTTKQGSDNRRTIGGSAWEWDENTQEYYLHLYVAKQPDLNWENPEMDVINLLSKVDGLPDAPVTVPGETLQPASMYFANGPRIHEFVKEMHAKILSKHDLITVGETPFTHSASELAAYVLPANNELNMVFHFEIMDLDSPKEGQDFSPLVPKEWSLQELKDIVGRWQKYKRDEGFWNAIFIENHDHSRAVSRFGNDSDEWRALSAKMIAILQVTQSGTQFVYQGQELGLKNFPRSWGIEEYKDIASLNYWNRILEGKKKDSGGEEIDMSNVLDGFQKKARDHARVPMQWDKTRHAGFSTGDPWMRVNEDYEQWNAEAQIVDPNSVHAFYKNALRVRKEHDVLIYGDFEDISGSHPAVFAYIRRLPGSLALVILNFKENEVDFELNTWLSSELKLKLVLSNYDSGLLVAPEAQGVHLRGYEGRLYIGVEQIWQD
ncbi:hypothetical protein NLJ89_g5789 [Agrocybe chaxingu]|uniref:Glycosyl hydrolase family 13 catalytic domain-containing protein n=1 Tax=Agrocybe chaxingu TaxID=84603 RepID=A0A9W8JZX4_9AGAR|nr:hypothetical protein NLJ89_g5789 [Agrocybe chaxingu]